MTLLKSSNSTKKCEKKKLSFCENLRDKRLLQTVLLHPKQKKSLLKRIRNKNENRRKKHSILTLSMLCLAHAKVSYLFVVVSQLILCCMQRGKQKTRTTQQPNTILDLFHCCFPSAFFFCR